MFKRILSLENLILLAILLGVIFGLLFPQVAVSVSLPGDIFLRLLKFVVIPLLFLSVFVSVAKIGRSQLSRIGGRALALYFTTTSLAVITGIVLVVILSPGVGEKITLGSAQTIKVKEFEISEFILSFFPSNPVKSFVEGNMIHIIFIALVFGISVSLASRSVRDSIIPFFSSFFDITLDIARWIIKLTPIGIFFIVASVAGKYGIEPFKALFPYALTVVLGLIFHFFVTLPFIGFILGRFNPFRFLHSIRRAVFFAFSTSSSSATLPVSLDVGVGKGKIKKEVAEFVLPLGSTVNMDGTALYESVAAVFIANVYGIALSTGDIILIFITATLASVGAAGIPGAGLITMVIVFQAVGLPLEGVGLIISIDRILDMLRTATNV